MIRLIWQFVVLTTLVAAAVAQNPTSQPGEADVGTAFQVTRQAAGSVRSGRAGLAIWEQFVKEHPVGPEADLARKEMEVWRPRADKGLVLFAAEWLPEEEAKQRVERSADLVEKAGKASKPLEALGLLNEAAKSNPQSVEIRFAIAAKCFQLKRQREFGTVMGDVLKIDPDQPAAMNNLAVLLAANKTWPTSLGWITHAAKHSDSESVLANLEQIAALAAADKCLDPALAAARGQIQKSVENIHKAGAHADEARWCGEWISQGDYNAFVASNKAFDVEIAKLRDRLAKLQAAYQQAKSVVDNYDKNRQRLTDDRDKPGRTDRYRRDIDAQLKQLEAQRDLTKDFVKQAEQDGGALQEQLRDMIGKKFIEGFAGRLVLLQADARTELAVISVDRDRREKRPPPGKAASQPDNAAAPAAPGGSSTAKDDPAGSR